MRKLAIVVALSSTVLATPALARDGAWYVGADFGAMIVEDIGFDFGRNPQIPGSNSNVEIDHRYGFDGAMFVGYDLGAFRLEAEVAYKRARLDEYETVIRLPGAGGVAGAPTAQLTADAGGGHTSALSFMINGMLDFGDDDGISGFIGGGVGVARVNYNNHRAFSNQGAFVDDSDTRFAWQIVAGVRQAISDNMDITVRYRFFNVDDISTVNWLGDVSETRFRSHSLLGGITLNFGAPVVVPPIQPCPPGWTRNVDGVCIAPPPPPEPVRTQTCPNGQVIPITAQCPAVQETIGPFIVFFDWDRDEITPQAAAILDNAAAAYRSTGQARVVLAGHADRSGPADYNVGLSQRRADNVRQYLAGRGIPDSAMTTEAFGESRPLVETADGVREPQNRRVEINFGPGSGW